MELKRCSGILMPISSLPGGYGIGSLGAPARRFVSFVAHHISHDVGTSHYCSNMAAVALQQSGSIFNLNLALD